MTYDRDAATQEAHAASQSQALTLLGDLTGDAIVTIGADRRVTGWSAGAQAMLGWSAAEALGRDGAFFQTAEDRADDAFAQACEAARKAGTVAHRRWLVHRDGSLVWGVGHFGPATLGLPGYVLIMRDETARKAETQALDEALTRFRTLAEGVPQLIWRSCEQGRWTWASPQWLAYTGQTQEQSQGWGWLEVVHPADRTATLHVWDGARPSGEVRTEFRLRRARDGAWRWHQTRSVPVRCTPTPERPDGRILEWLGTTTDIEDLKQSQGRQAVLVSELQHRTRNLLAVVSAIARRNFGRTEASEEFQLRLATLGRVQGFLSRADNWSLDLAELVRTELDAVGNGESKKAIMDGPQIELPGDKAQPVALALHELATNAVKYGALSQPSGRLAVLWTLEDDGATGRQLVLKWRESNVVMQTGYVRRRGYGSELIERALPYQLKARTELVFGPDGVACTLTLPLGGEPAVNDQ